MHIYRDLKASIPTVPEGRAALPLALTTVFQSLARPKELTKCVSNDLVIYIFFIYSFLATLGLSLVVASGGYSLLWCSDFSLQWLLLLQSMGFRARGLSSCGTWA